MMWKKKEGPIVPLSFLFSLSPTFSFSRFEFSYINDSFRSWIEYTIPARKQYTQRRLCVVFLFVLICYHHLNKVDYPAHLCLLDSVSNVRTFTVRMEIKPQSVVSLLSKKIKKCYIYICMYIFLLLLKSYRTLSAVEPYVTICHCIFVNIIKI